MKSYVVEIYVEDAQGKPWKQEPDQHVKAESIEDARAGVGRLLVAKKLRDKLRSINFSPDGKIRVYCGEKKQRSPRQQPGVTQMWRRPPGPSKM